MTEKRNSGTTLLTCVHHRETPERLAAGTIDAGPVWATEAIHARTTGLAFDIVEPGPALDQRDQVNYYVARLQNAPNPSNADRFIDFILSRKAREIYESSGFITRTDDETASC